MKVILHSLLFLFPFTALAATWDQCLDQADFSLESGSFNNEAKVSKTGCHFRFVVYGMKSEKYDLNVCDPSVHIDFYPSVEAQIPKAVLGGSANCPKPLFGADFDAKEGDFAKFDAMRQKIFALFQGIAKEYGSSDADLSKIVLGKSKEAAPKLACAKFLLEDYLNKCVAFEEKKKLEKVEVLEKDLPPGVRPQTITIPKK